MKFADTYSYEILQSRKIRSQRAFFWSRIVGLALMITIGATLRADPQLREVLMRAGMDGVSRVASLQNGGQFQPSAPAGINATDETSRPRIKINRPGVSTQAQDQDAAGIAQQVGSALVRHRVGN